MSFINCTDKFMPYNTGSVCGIVLPRSNKFLRLPQLYRKLFAAKAQSNNSHLTTTLNIAITLSLQTVKPRSIHQTSSTVQTIFEAYSYKFLQHKTTLERLPSILAIGALVTGEKVPYPPSELGYGDNRPGMVFFSATKRTVNPDCHLFHSECWSPAWGNGNQDLEVTLLFHLSVLKTAPFHVIEHGMNYGNYDSKTDYHHSQPLSKLNTLLLQRGKELCGEVVVYDDVPVSKLCAIWVEPNKKNYVFDFLKSKNITVINTTPLHAWINKDF